MEKQAKETQSTPLFTTRALFALIWPMLMEQFLSITMGMADTFMVSAWARQLFQCQSGGQYQCAGNAVICCADGWRSYYHKPVSGAQGQRKRSAQCGAVVHGFYDCNVDADGGSSGVASADSTSGVWCDRCRCHAYVRNIFYHHAVSYPFIGLYNAGTALFRVQGNSRISMFASLVMNAINIAGNAVLIYGLKIGVLGAATATLTGRVFAAVWVYTRQQHNDNPLRITELALLRPQKNLICRILGLGVPPGWKTVCFRLASSASAVWFPRWVRRPLRPTLWQTRSAVFLPAGHDHRHCDDPGSGALSGGRGQKTGASLCTSAHAGGLRWVGGVQFGSVRGDSRNHPTVFAFGGRYGKLHTGCAGVQYRQRFFLGEPALHCRTPCAAAATPVLRWQSAF